MADDARSPGVVHSPVITGDLKSFVMMDKNASAVTWTNSAGLGLEPQAAGSVIPGTLGQFKTAFGCKYLAFRFRGHLRSRLQIGIRNRSRLQ